MLDDVSVLYYNGDTNTFFGRGNTTNEDSLYDPGELTSISDSIDERWAIVDYLYKPKGKRIVDHLTRKIVCFQLCKENVNDAWQ